MAHKGHTLSIWFEKGGVTFEIGFEGTEVNALRDGQSQVQLSSSVGPGSKPNVTSLVVKRVTLNVYCACAVEDLVRVPRDVAVIGDDCRNFPLEPVCAGSTVSGNTQKQV